MNPYSFGKVSNRAVLVSDTQSRHTHTHTLKKTKHTLAMPPFLKISFGKSISCMLRQIAVQCSYICKC